MAAILFRIFKSDGRTVLTKIAAIHSFYTAERYQSELGRTFSFEPLTIL